MQRVFVLDGHRQPLMPCAPARARQLLARGRAAVYRRAPFTIILRDRAGGDTQPIALQADPGSRTTGLALVAAFDRGREVLWAAELTHRGLAVGKALESRRALRRGRRSRKTRYRAPRSFKRPHPVGWLAPSLRSRVDNVAAWGRRLGALAPLASVAVETVRFDTQILEKPDIEGVAYQQGTLYGTELREYLLYRYGHQCAYCHGLSGDPVLEREHIHPRSGGGSNRVGNQCIACHTCNADKDNKPPKVWLAQLQSSPRALDQARAENFRSILDGVRPSLRDAAAVNATRYAVGDALQALGLPTRFWSGGRTKFNRTGQGYPKAHWIDAACVGDQGQAVRLDPEQTPLRITATGRGRRQVCRVDRFGFPRTGAGRSKRVHGFQTGDLVRLEQPRGKYAGVHTGRLAGVRADGRFDIATAKGKITSSWRRYQLIQRGDGYAYA